MDKVIQEFHNNFGNDATLVPRDGREFGTLCFLCGGSGALAVCQGVCGQRHACCEIGTEKVGMQKKVCFVLGSGFSSGETKFYCPECIEMKAPGAPVKEPCNLWKYYDVPTAVWPGISLVNYYPKGDHVYSLVGAQAGGLHSHMAERANMMEAWSQKAHLHNVLFDYHDLTSSEGRKDARRTGRKVVYDVVACSEIHRLQTQQKKVPPKMGQRYIEDADNVDDDDYNPNSKSKKRKRKDEQVPQSADIQADPLSWTISGFHKVQHLVWTISCHSSDKDGSLFAHDGEGQSVPASAALHNLMPTFEGRRLPELYPGLKIAVVLTCGGFARLAGEEQIPKILNDGFDYVLCFDNMRFQVGPVVHPLSEFLIDTLVLGHNPFQAVQSRKAFSPEWMVSNGGLRLWSKTHRLDLTPATPYGTFPNGWTQPGFLCGHCGNGILRLTDRNKRARGDGPLRSLVAYCCYPPCMEANRAKEEDPEPAQASTLTDHEMSILGAFAPHEGGTRWDAEFGRLGLNRDVVMQKCIRIPVSVLVSAGARKITFETEVSRFDENNPDHLIYYTVSPRIRKDMHVIRDLQAD